MTDRADISCFVSCVKCQNAFERWYNTKPKAENNVEKS